MEINISQIFINAVLAGSVYSLMAIGLSMIYRILKFANFAHAEFFTFGAYIAYAVNVSLKGSLILGIVAAFIATGLLAVVSDLIFFRKLRRKRATTIS